VLEVMLEQSQADTVRALLVRSDAHEFFLSDYALHSIGLLLCRRKLHQAFRQFLSDMIRQAGTRVVSLAVDELEQVAEISQRYELDVDDADQYVVSERHPVSFCCRPGEAIPR
jgi:predicted nucleic acid-binding protein